MLGELLAQEIEAMLGGQRVERRFYLAGSYLCQQALLERAHRWVCGVHRNGADGDLEAAAATDRERDAAQRDATIRSGSMRAALPGRTS